MSVFFAVVTVIVVSMIVTRVVVVVLHFLGRNGRRRWNLGFRRIAAVDAQKQDTRTKADGARSFFVIDSL